MVQAVRGAAVRGSAWHGQARQGGFGPQEAGGRNRQPAGAGARYQDARWRRTKTGRQGGQMDGMEIYRKHELNPWWWMVVPAGSLGALAVVHFLARW